MFCPHCGKQLPDGAKFCTACGAPVGGPSPAPAQPPRQASYAPQSAPQPKKKSKAGPIIAVAAVIAALVLGIFVIGPAMRGAGDEHVDLSKSSQDEAPAETPEAEAGSSRSRAAAAARYWSSKEDSDQAAEDSGQATEDSGQTAESGGQAVRETNDEYYQALAVIGYNTPMSIVKMGSGLQDPTLEFFVRDNGDGSIECHDYAAEGDTVVKYNETVLLDMSGVPAEQKEQLVQSLTGGLPALDSLEFVTAGYQEKSDGTGGRLTIECTGLDQEENWQVLRDMGIFSQDGPYSLAALKQAELADGYISLYK